MNRVRITEILSGVPADARHDAANMLFARLLSIHA